jgi:hypothetical protein
MDHYDTKPEPERPGMQMLIKNEQHWPAANVVIDKPA